MFFVLVFFICCKNTFLQQTKKTKPSCVVFHFVKNNAKIYLVQKCPDALLKSILVSNLFLQGNCYVFCKTKQNKKQNTAFLRTFCRTKCCLQKCIFASAPNSFLHQACFCTAKIQGTCGKGTKQKNKKHKISFSLLFPILIKNRDFI